MRNDCYFQACLVAKLTPLIYAIKQLRLNTIQTKISAGRFTRIFWIWNIGLHIPLIASTLYTSPRLYPSPVTSGKYNVLFRVRSGNAFAYSQSVSFKKFPWISTNGDFTHAFIPGDSAEVFVSGVTSNSTCAASIYISGSKSSGCSWPEQYFNTSLYFVSTPCPCNDYATVVYGCDGNGSSLQGRLISYSAESESADVVINIPKEFFGTSYGLGYGPVVDVYAKVVNSDGRSSKPVKWALATFPDH
jgi:hypothetical protein